MNRRENVATPNGIRTIENLDGIFVGIGVLGLEAELNAGHIHVEMNNGRYWQVRRNGATQLWKCDLNRFRIPVKVGFRGYTAITNENLRDFWVVVD